MRYQVRYVRYRVRYVRYQERYQVAVLRYARKLITQHFYDALRALRVCVTCQPDIAPDNTLITHCCMRFSRASANPLWCEQK